MITNKEKWDAYVKANTSEYGRECVNIVRRVMEILDNTKGRLKVSYNPNPVSAYEIIYNANKDVKARGVLALISAHGLNMVYQCHSRGLEFYLSVHLTPDVIINEMVDELAKSEIANGRTRDEIMKMAEDMIIGVIR
jgi:hypothetical protein